jgi:hypothetical protein
MFMSSLSLLFYDESYLEDSSRDEVCQRPLVEIIPIENSCEAAPVLWAPAEQRLDGWYYIILLICTIKGKVIFGVVCPPPPRFVLPILVESWLARRGVVASCRL